MKKYLFLTFLSISASFYTQEIGGEGRKFRNEITGREKTRINKNIFHERRNIYGADRQAQLWLRVLDGGRFRVEVGGQIIENSTGLFRFFDLELGRQVLSIYENNMLIYRTQVVFRENTRLLLDFDGYDLYLFREENIGGSSYEIPINPVPMGYIRIMDAYDFEQFYKSYTNKSFDKDKMQFFYVGLKNTYFTAQQIAQMVKALSFSDNQLEMAKKAYDHCIDRESYYKVADAMTYRATKDELQEYILKRR